MNIIASISAYAKKHQASLIFIIICIAYFLRVRELVINETLHIDEVITWNWIASDWSDFFHYVYNDTQPLFFYLILKVLFEIKPLNDYWLRIPSILFSIMTLFQLATYINKKTTMLYALLALALVSSIDLFQEISIFARPYSLLLLLIVINILSIRASIESNKRIPRIFYISVFLISVTHHLGFIYLLSLFISSLFFFDMRRFLRSYLKTFVVIFPSLIYFFLQYLNNSYLIDWVKEEQERFSFLSLFQTGQNEWPNIISFLFSIILVCTFWKKINNFNKFVFSIMMLSIALITLSQFSSISLLYPRYFSFIIPFYVFTLVHTLHFHLKLKDNFVIIFIFLVLHFDNFPRSIFTSRLNIKKFISEMPSTIVENNKVLCVYQFFPGVLSSYSHNRFGRNICDLTVKSLKDISDIGTYESIININSKFDYTVNLELGKLLYQFEEFSIYENAKFLKKLEESD